MKDINICQKCMENRKMTMRGTWKKMIEFGVRIETFDENIGVKEFSYVDQRQNARFTINLEDTCIYNCEYELEHIVMSQK